ncbi:hypothetical protein NDU88_009604, partial [Pleurodeles waltl]
SQLCPSVLRRRSQGSAESLCAAGDYHGGFTETQPSPCTQPPAHACLPPACPTVSAVLHA